MCRTGSLVKVNEQDVALFRYGDIVYAISEHCPHAGKLLIRNSNSKISS